MNLAIVITFLTVLQVNALPSMGQKINIKSNKTEIKTVLKLIESGGHYRFLYNSDLKDLKNKVDFSANNLTIEQALSELFKGTNLAYKTLEGNLIAILSSNEVEKDRLGIAGKITNELGEPVPAASIQIKGVNKGTISDDRGNFVLSAPENAILIIIAVGYTTTEVPVNGQQQIAVQLKQSSRKLDEVVVIGYGSSRRRELTTSTSKVRGEELAKQPVINAAQALQGKASGVQVIGVGKPGESPTVVIRGVGTALGTSNVLYIVDGMLTENISNINTNDIVSMDILKDASATAIYGSRGANGVVLVTTKKGTAGKMTLEYGNNSGVRMASNLVTMANAAEYTNYYQATSGNAPSLNPGYSTDWYDEILRPALYHNHNVTFSGGNEKTLHYLSVGYLDEDGIVLNNNFKRLTARINEEFRFSDKLKFGFQGSFTNSQNRDVNLGGAYNDAYRATPLIPAMVDGKYGNTSLYQNVGNPVLDLNQNNSKQLNNKFQATSYIQYKPYKWLTYKSSLGVDLGYSDGKIYGYKFFADANYFITPGGNQQSPQSSLRMSSSKKYWWVWDNTLSVDQKIGEDHNFSFLLGTTAEKFNTNGIEGFRKNVPENQDLWYLSAGDPNTSTNNSFADYWAHNSYFTRINYNFKNKYYLTGSLRTDGTSRLPEKNRWRRYPAISAAWLLSNESFISKIKWIDFLKIRGGWGKVGNENIPTNSFQNTYENGYAYAFQSGGIAQNGMVSTRIVDENITWEETKDIEMGLDFTLFQNKLSGEISYYDKNVTNALFPIYIPSTGGSSYPVIANVASINNKGWELTLSWNDKLSEKIGYKIGGNITNNNNLVTKVNFPSTIIDGGIGANQSYTTVTKEGLPIGTFSVYQVLGVFQNQEEINNYKNKAGIIIQNTAQPGDFKYKDANDDGKIDDLDRINAGAYQPKYFYNLNFAINYNQFELSADWYGVSGNNVYNGKKAFRQALKDNVEKDVAYKRWVPGRGINDEPAANGGNLPASTYFVESGSFIRLNNVSLNYTFSPKQLVRLKLSSLRIYATAQNVFTFKKFSGFTPELPGTPTASGIEKDAYPTTKTISFGINVGF